MQNTNASAQTWSTKDSAVQELSKAFQAYLNSSGKTGLKPNPKPSKEEIEAIADQIPDLKQYKADRLKINIANLAKRANLEHSIKRSRPEQGKSTNFLF